MIDYEAIGASQNQKKQKIEPFYSKNDYVCPIKLFFCNLKS
jgi:hypothetical protein